MKRKAFIGLVILSLCFVLGGVYITAGMNRVVGKLQDIILLQQMHSQRKALIEKIKEVQTDLLLKDSPHAVDIDTFVQHGEEMAATLNGCFSCHHLPGATLTKKIGSLQTNLETYQGKLSRVYTLRANAERLATAKKSAYEAGEELQFTIARIFSNADLKIAERTTQAQQLISSTRGLFIVLVTIGPLFVLLVSSYFFSHFSSGVKILTKAFSKIQEGDLKYRIDEKMDDEFRLLADAFNNMGMSLKEQCQRVESIQKRYRMLFESAGDSIFILEAEGKGAGRIISANKAAADTHGYAVEELHNMHISDLDDPAAATEIPHRIRRILAGEWLNEVVNHRKKDGTVFPVEISAGLLEYDGHKYILAFDRDISERVKADEALQRARQLAMVGEMAAGLAHEIKNPLAGIKVSIEILAEDLVLAQEDKEVFLRVIQEVNRLENLVKNLLNYARPPKPRFEPVNLNVLLTNSVKNAEMIVKSPHYFTDSKKAIRFLTELPPALPPVRADASQLQQIFLNLLLNSIDALGESGTITVRTGLDHSGNMQIIIKDNGKGFDDEGLQKAFQPFHTTKSKGTGLGLAITKRLVDQHHGRIELTSTKGEGSVFTITLPVNQDNEVSVS
ncbi:MAG: PAS domain S-box protein [Proteobacteria bacterium]|nr:PAS domain S-box protein [Pseudomonadota bacterium]MBU1641020.1 PAS domain S-box protein [Pseudomonadota bacterium]